MEQGAEKIAQPLAFNTTLTTLYLGVRLLYFQLTNKKQTSIIKRATQLEIKEQKKLEQHWQPTMH